MLESVEVEKLNNSYDLPHKNFLTPDKVLSLGGHYMILRECHRMVLLLVAVCWWRVNRYKPSKWTIFRIFHQNRVQNIIQCHDNNIWKQMCIIKLCYSTETYILYTVQRRKQVEIYMWYLHHELILFLQSMNCFSCVPDNEIEGDILGWNMSYTTHKTHRKMMQRVVQPNNIYHDCS